MKDYIIHKVLNNNIVQCLEQYKGEECMLLGKGIGFQKRKGDSVEDDKVEKVYFIKDTKNISKYEKLVQQCDENLVQAVEEVIIRMEEKFGRVYDEYLHIALLDHMNFSIYRFQNNIQVNNIFLDEYSIMYAEEFSFAKEMLAFISEQIHLQLPASEIGFITLHIHSALHKEDVSRSALFMQVIGDCINMVEQHLQITLDSCSIERMRLITHLKFALERAEKEIVLENLVLASLEQTYPQTFQLAKDMGTMIKESFGIELPVGEIGYITLHIQNIIMTSSKEKK